MYKREKINCSLLFFFFLKINSTRVEIGFKTMKKISFNTFGCSSLHRFPLFQSFHQKYHQIAFLVFGFILPSVAETAGISFHS